MWWMYFDFRSKHLYYCYTALDVNCFFISNCNHRVTSSYSCLYDNRYSRYNKHRMSCCKYYFSSYGKGYNY